MLLLPALAARGGKRRGGLPPHRGEAPDSGAQTPAEEATGGADEEYPDGDDQYQESEATGSGRRRSRATRASAATRARPSLSPSRCCTSAASA